MILSELKNILKTLKTVEFQLPNGKLVENHFHISEVGKVSKNFIDCGGTARIKEVVNLQFWSANDYDHRLHPEKITQIISVSEQAVPMPPTAEIEVEYQGEVTMEKYNLEFNGERFLLTPKHTGCLAPEHCTPSNDNENCCAPTKKPKIKLSELQTSCAPNSSCC